MQTLALLLIGFWIGVCVTSTGLYLLVKFLSNDDSPLVGEEPVGRYVALKTGQEVVDIQKISNN